MSTQTIPQPDARPTSVRLRDAEAELDRLRRFATQVTQLDQLEGRTRFRTVNDLILAAEEALGVPS
ncbi:hypothetical protein ACWKSP_26280 [Micromonosporaceae bacterium Da 78-11]